MGIEKKLAGGGEEVRLHVFLANKGVGSRRQCEQYISEGLVKVNGKIQTRLGVKVKAGDLVEYKGRKISWNLEDKVYIALYKPEKYICSHEDSQERALAVNLVQPFFTQRLFYVGRLDYMTSGLLLLTNDGEFAKKLMHPSFEVEKEYEVKTGQEIPMELLERFKRGIWIKGERYQLKSYVMRGMREANLVLTEGKNQEIRQVFLSWCISIKRIHRFRIGSLTLRGLAPGQFRKLTKSEVSRLLSETKPAKLRIYQTKACTVQAIQTSRKEQSLHSFNERTVYQDPAVLREKRDKKERFKKQRGEVLDVSQFHSKNTERSSMVDRRQGRSGQLSFGFIDEKHEVEPVRLSRYNFSKNVRGKAYLESKEEKLPYSTKNRTFSGSSKKVVKAFHKVKSSSLKKTSSQMSKPFVHSSLKPIAAKGGKGDSRHRRSSRSW